MIASVLTAALVAAGVAGTAPAAPAEPTVVERRLVLMGTEAEVRVEAPAGEGSRPAALAASEAAVRALERAEARLSTWTSESELSGLNRAPVGEPVALSPELAGELAAAEACRRATGGAFDPGVGPLVDAWGLRDGGRLPHPDELAAARLAAGGEGLEFRDDGTALRLRPGLRIEEGGFGKGAALDAALAAVAPAAGILVDLGGQVALRPPAAASVAGGGREVAVAHPRDRRRPVVAVTVSSGSVATSGNSERGLEVAGERLSHVLDPRTGRPAPDFGSLTVLAPDGLRADCLSTGLYVLGPDAALAWAAEHPGVEVVVLRTFDDAGGVEVLASPGLRGRLRALDGEIVREIRYLGGSGTPAWEAGIDDSRGAGATDASEAYRATRRSPSDRGHRGIAR